ncbi:unnamed protein product [Penicillium roqueforti FM164]|uniref:Genomic scaffold, ProqFM164S04 n=1 Tax=Penicillium roqueforti (strain FM164) TaxID=1365484 RepID=W6QNC8_PENRF|nr:unnamed protein product [Penicillium roqueforti FM164]
MDSKKVDPRGIEPRISEEPHENSRGMATIAPNQTDLVQ